MLKDGEIDAQRAAESLHRAVRILGEMLRKVPGFRKTDSRQSSNLGSLYTSENVRIEAQWLIPFIVSGYSWKRNDEASVVVAGVH